MKSLKTYVKKDRRIRFVRMWRKEVFRKLVQEESCMDSLERKTLCRHLLKTEIPMDDDDRWWFLMMMTMIVDWLSSYNFHKYSFNTMLQNIYSPNKPTRYWITTSMMSSDSKYSGVNSSTDPSSQLPPGMNTTTGSWGLV